MRTTTFALALLLGVAPLAGMTASAQDYSSPLAQLNGTLSPTPGQFTSVLGQDPNGHRRSCEFLNNSSAPMLVYWGPTSQATAANSFPLPAGQVALCTGYDGITAQENIAVSSPTLANAPYVLFVRARVN